MKFAIQFKNVFVFIGCGDVSDTFFNILKLPFCVQVCIPHFIVATIL